LSDSILLDIWKNFKKNKAALVSAIFILFLFFVAIFAPFISPYPYDQVDFSAIHALPGEEFVLGADGLGRDILSRLIFGTRVSLMVGIISQVFMVIIGIPLGLIAGYYGGKLDMVIMRVVDILYSFPSLLFMILIMTLLKGLFQQEPSVIIRTLSNIDSAIGGLLGIFVSIGIIAWLPVSRVVRGETLSVKGQDYVQAAKSLGSRDRRIIFKHILPNIAPSIIVAVTYGVPSFIMMEAALSFLGLGVEPPMTSWGAMLSQSFGSIRSYPHLLIPPAIALALTMLAFNFVGDGLRSALDPYSRKR